MKSRAKAIVIVVIVAIVVLAGGISYLVLVPTPPKPNPGGSLAANCPQSSSSTGNRVAGNWTTYHGGNSRSGYQPMAGIASVHPKWSGPTGLDGQVYAEPLLCGDSVFVATESDSVYAINATTGAVLWRTHLGSPVAGSSLPCGDIDPSGITATPVIDRSSGTIYLVAFLSPHTHELFGLNLHNGSVKSHVLVDPTGSDPTVEQVRGALILANGVVYIPFGGLYGDCGSYHGWVVGVRTDGTGGLLSYEVPTGRAGGIWTPSGISIGSNGNLYVATGNSDATTTFDFGDAVIELSPTLQELDYFAPTNWAALNSGDTDLGTVAPATLPNGDLFQVGKEGVGYLLSGTHLGGVGGQLSSGSVCSSAYGGTAQVGLSVFVPCTDGLVRVNVTTSNFSVAWQTSGFNSGSPIVTGDVVWAVNVSAGDLLGFNLSTGQELFAFPLGSVDHFISPAAAPGSLFVAAGNQLFGFTLA